MNQFRNLLHLQHGKSSTCLCALLPDTLLLWEALHPILSQNSHVTLKKYRLYFYIIGLFKKNGECGGGVTSVCHCQVMPFGQNCSFNAVLDFTKQSEMLLSIAKTFLNKRATFLFMSIGTSENKGHYVLMIVWSGSVLLKFSIIHFVVLLDLLLP